MRNFVKCVDCGFLAIRGAYDRELFEAESTFRETAQLPRSGGGREYEQIPVCFAGAFSLRKEIVGDRPDAILSTISKERPCEAFTDWKHGYSPKEHQEMLDRQWLLDFQAKREDGFREWQREADESDKRWREAQAQAEREWREKQAADDKAWREQQAGDQREWNERQSSNEERRHRVNLVVLGLLTIIAGLVGAAIQADWIPNFISWLFDKQAI